MKKKLKKKDSKYPLGLGTALTGIASGFGTNPIGSLGGLADTASKAVGLYATTQKDDKAAKYAGMLGNVASTLGTFGKTVEDNKAKSKVVEDINITPEDIQKEAERSPAVDMPERGKLALAGSMAKNGMKYRYGKTTRPKIKRTSKKYNLGLKGDSSKLRMSPGLNF